MIDRASLLRRAGAGAAGVSLAELLGPAAAFASGGGNFPDHPRWRFVFVSHSTLDPLFVATQFGAQDAAALVRCSIQWTGSPRGSAEETARSLRSAVSHKADGIAVSMVDPGGFAAEVEAAHEAQIPVVAFNVDAAPGNHRVAYVGENAFRFGTKVGGEIRRLAPRGRVLLFAPARPSRSAKDRLSGVLRGLASGASGPGAEVVRLEGSLRDQESEVETAFKKARGVRGLFAMEGGGTLAVGRVIERLGLAKRGVQGGGYDLLPNDLKLVADGHLDFVVDQQPYVQGFDPVMQLFLARISQGTVTPCDTETSILLRKADVQAYIQTKSRFEGSSSRHEYPLRRG